MADDNDSKAKRKNPIARPVNFIKQGIWEVDLDSLGWWRRMGVQVLRFVSVTAMGFSGHRCGLHAAGLTYFSLLSVIPVLLLMLLLTKPCGMYEWAREKIRTQTDQMITSFFNPKPASDATTAQSAAPTDPSAAKGLAALPEPASPDDSKSLNTQPTPSTPSTPSNLKPQTSNSSNSSSDFGAQARELRDQILGQIDAKIQKFNFGLAALFGFLMLAWTVIKTFGQVEASFNEIWNVARNRPIWRKAYLYTSSIMVLPLLLALAMSMPIIRVVRTVVDSTLGSTAYTKWAGDVVIALLDSALFSNFIVWFFLALAFAFLFKAMPNRRVLLPAAVKGGMVTGALLGLWMRLGAMLQFGIAQSSAAYGSFALVPILIIWLNMSWTIILLGSNMTYAFQCIHTRVRELPGL